MAKKYIDMSPNADTSAHYIFDNFNEKFFENKLNNVVFKYKYVRSVLLGEFENLSPPIISIALHKKFFYMYNQKRIDLLETILHEMTHLWQHQFNLKDKSKILRFDEYHKLYEEGKYEEIAKRQAESDNYYIMHDDNFSEKLKSFGIVESYSGKKKTIY